MQVDYASSTAPMELVTVFSESLTATSWAGGVLTLSDGTHVTFVGGPGVVPRVGARRRRAVRH